MKWFFLLFFSATLISCGEDHGKTVTQDGHKLYYLEPVTEQEAKNVLSWLIKVNHNFGQPEQPFQLSKQTDRYVFRYPAQNNTPEEIEGNMGYMTTFREKLSQDALGGAKTDVVIVDPEMKELRRISAP